MRMNSITAIWTCKLGRQAACMSLYIICPCVSLHLLYCILDAAASAAAAADASAAAAADHKIDVVIMMRP